MMKVIPILKDHMKHEPPIGLIKIPKELQERIINLWKDGHEVLLRGAYRPQDKEIDHITLYISNHSERNEKHGNL